MRRSKRPRTAQKSWGRSDPSQRGRLLLKLADAIEAHADELIELEARDTGHPVRDARRLDVPAHLGLLPLFRRHGRQVRRVPAAGLSGLPQLCAARAGRRGRPDRAVEFSADVHQLEDGAGAGRRQHDRAEAGRADAAVDAAHRRADAGGRLSRRRRQHRAGLRPHRRRAACRASRRQEDRLHRLDRDRTAHRPGVGRRTSRRCSWSSAARGRTSCSPTPRSRRRSAGSAWAIFHNQGQACIAGSRIILHEKIADEFLERFIALAQSIRLGNQLDDDDRDGAADLQAAPGARAAFLESGDARKAARS